MLQNACCYTVIFIINVKLKRFESLVDLQRNKTTNHFGYEISKKVSNNIWTEFAIFSPQNSKFAEKEFF